MNPSSEEEEDFETGTITRIGMKFQSSMPTFGQISIPHHECRKVWDSRRLPHSAVDEYLSQAKHLWEVSYLNALVPFNEQDACKILHTKGYNPQSALQAIVHERLPYIVCKFYLVTEHDKDRKDQDIVALRNGESLSM